MKKISGKALSLVLSLALVVSSFSTSFASASTSHTVKGTLSDTDKDVIYAVNGETGTGSTLVVDSDIQSYIFGSNDATLETADHQHKPAAKISAIAHSSGDRLVKWYEADDNDKDAIDDDTNKVALELRSDSVEGHEVLNIQYSATYTDDDEKDFTIKGSKTFDVYVYDKNQPVIGDASKLSDANTKQNKTVELSDNFAQKTLSKEIGTANATEDSKNLSVYTPAPTSVNSTVTPQITWTALKTVAKGTTIPANNATTDQIFYVLKSSSDIVGVSNTSSDATGASGVTALVSGKNTGSVTFTAEATAYATASNTVVGSTSEGLSTTKDVTVKSKVEKKLLVDDSRFNKIAKVSGNTYIGNGTLDTTSVKDSHVAFKINGYEVNFDDATIGVTVSNKASVSKISGKAGSINVSEGTVDAIALDDSATSEASPIIVVSEAKVSSIDFGDKGTTDRKVTVDSPKAIVGDVTDADSIIVNSGKTGNLTAADVEIKAEDDDTATTVGNVKATTLTIDSEDSKVTTGVLTAKDASSSFTLSGDSVSVKGIDFDNRDTNLIFDDFQGSIPAPVNASQDGASFQTQNADDKVEVTGDIDIDSVSIEEDSTVTFDGKVNVTSVDGSGTLVVGAGKMYIDGSASGTILKLSDPNFTKGTVAFTALSDCVETDDFDTFGFTLAKTSGSKTDTFKVDSIEFKGLSVNKSSISIAKGYSETFTAGSYPAGLTIPSGYTVEWTMDDANDSIFALTTNADGSATVKVIGYDTEFSSENKTTLKAQLVDANGDVDEDYTDGECAVTALAVPAVNYKSDTTGDVKMNVGGTYQFKITSLDGTVPAFGLGSTIAAVTSNSKSGNDYFYKVTAKQAGDVGVYVNGSRVAILRISAASAKIDTTSVKIKVGGTYQFKVTSATKPAFGFGSSALQTVSTSNQGQDYFYKVKAVSGKTGDQVGVYVNGSRAAIVTIG